MAKITVEHNGLSRSITVPDQMTGRVIAAIAFRLAWRPTDGDPLTFILARGKRWMTDSLQLKEAAEDADVARQRKIQAIEVEASAITVTTDPPAPV